MADAAFCPECDIRRGSFNPRCPTCMEEHDRKLLVGPYRGLYKQTVTKSADLPITGERPRDVGAPGAAT